VSGTEAPPAPPSSSPESRYPSFAARASHFTVASAAVGVVLVADGLLATLHPLPDLYRTPLSGYDTPFDVVAGLILLAVSYRIRRRSSVAWLFSIPVPVLAGAIAILSPDPYAILSTVLSAALLAAVYPYRSAFYLGSPTGPEGTQLTLIVASLAAVLLGMVGARWLGSQFSPPIGTWGQSLYFTVVTVSTIGGTYVPVTDTARWFSVVLILVGVGTFLSAVVVLFVPFLQNRLATVGQRFERTQMQELEQHIIVCGVSPEAHAAARAIREANVRQVILAADAAAIEHLRTEGFRCHVGDPSSEEEVRLVRIDRARAVIVAQESDAANLLTVITARALAPNLRIVAVATSENNLPKLRRAGATETIGTVRVAARLICAAALETRDPDPTTPRSVPP